MNAIDTREDVRRVQLMNLSNFLKSVWNPLTGFNPEGSKEELPKAGVGNF